jgi:hypothetical protein
MVASSYGQRPSSILGIDDERLAYDFDLSVVMIALTKDEPKKDDPNAWGDWKALAAKRGK